MATLNELGRNSASITYGPYANGADHWPTLALLDQWTCNDTLQGVVTTSGTTVNGTGTLFSTQLRTGDIIHINGQMRTVNVVTSDTTFTVTSAFSPDISVSAQAKMIQAVLTGNCATSIGSSSTQGTVAVTNGGTAVSGTNTYFLAEATNSVVVVSMSGTVAVDTGGNITGSGTTFVTAQGTTNGLYPGDFVQIGSAYYQIATVTSDTAATLTLTSLTAIPGGTSIGKATNGVAGRTIIINGRVRVISSITSNTLMTLTTPMDFTGSGLKYQTRPRGTVSISAASQSVTGANTNFSWDLTSGDQVWLGDELRTFSFSTNATTAATVTDYIGFSGSAVNVLRQAVTNIPFFPDRTIITGLNTAFTTELRVGDEIIIDGTEISVATIISDTQFRASMSMSHNSTSTIYKKKKMHGFVHEGTREGAAAGGKFSQQTTMLATTGTLYAAGVNTIVVASATNFVQYNFIKIQGGGGPSIAITGSATLTTSTVTGVSTQFTTQLHVGAEICMAGQYFTVTAIASDTSLTVTPSGTIASATPIFRTQPLYTYIASIVSTTVVLGHPLKNNIYSNGTNPPMIYTPSSATDYLEYIYSAPNKSAEASTALFNTSNDRKYFGFRYYPLATGGGSGNTMATAGGAINLVVYERWAAAYAQTNGVGVNLANLSDSTAAVSGVTDQTALYNTTGAYLYLFAKPRYFILQGKNFSNLITPWLGVLEFERAQPEDASTGVGTTSGITYTAAPPVSYTPSASPWPTYGYCNGNRFPVGAQQTPTSPVAHTQGVHGCVISVPRIRNSVGDLVGLNSHVYSAFTITTGRWGHFYELGGAGSYTAPNIPSAGSPSFPANTFPAPHMGQMVPTYTNVYNAKRFMFSPVVVLGPTYDPDIRGRLYGLKVIPSSLGTLMDTVSVTIDSNDFYDSAQSAADHWVLTAAVNTSRVTLGGTNFQSTRSLEDSGSSSANTVSTYTNSFRFAIPA